MAAASAGTTHKSVFYAINHLFLPPVLPHKHDSSQPRVQWLVSFAIEALQTYAARSQGHHKAITKVATDTITSFVELHTIGDSQISVQAELLAAKLQDLCTTVTEYLSSILHALGSTIEVQAIKKSMREEIMYSSCRLPWTRSQTWLLLRVGLHLTTSRLEAELDASTESPRAPMYKEFIAYLMATLLQEAYKHNVESDLLSVMTSKVSRRFRKLGIIASSWLREPRFPQGRLCLHPETYLKTITQLDMQELTATFALRSSLHELDPDELPYVQVDVDDYRSFHLAGLESWVEHSLDRWLEHNTSTSSTCRSIWTVLYKYHSAAHAAYQSNPEAFSLMILTCLELWIACNKSALTICLELGKYHDSSVQPNLIRDLLQSLLLPRKSQLDRLNRVEEYLNPCSKNRRAVTLSIFDSFGKSNNFYVMYFESSQQQQELYDRIYSQAGQAREQKKIELAMKKKKHENLKCEANGMCCDYYDVFRGKYHSTEHDQWSCRKCRVVREYQAMEIEVHEWPLPKNTAEARNAVFELAPPEWFPACPHTGVFTSSVALTDIIAQQCMLKLPSKDSTMQRFLYSPASDPSGPPPNAVIAAQHDCPQHMTLAEFRELCVLPLGFKLQWQNILRQLQAPSVDFNQASTFIFHAQCINQVGPADSGNVLRASHAIFADHNFSQELLDGVVIAPSRLAESWQSAEALRTFILIATRALRLITGTGIIHMYLDFLASASSTVLGWAVSLRDKARLSDAAQTRDDLRRRAARCALICSLSFDVEDDHLPSALQTRLAASEFLQCSMIAREGIDSENSSNSSDTLFWQWQRISHRALPILSRFITRGSRALDDAISSSWSGHTSQQTWLAVSGQFLEWLVGTACEINSPIVRFNLLTGELLVNGLPLNRLPSEYESHKIYKTLFGSSIIDVMPGNVPGFPFSTNVPFASHDVQFALISSELFVRATKDYHTFHYVPSRLLRGCFPDAFVDDYVHFYDETTQTVSLRLLSHPWAAPCIPWTLSRGAAGDRWQLRKDNVTVISLSTRTSKVMAEILGTLTDEARIHCLASANHKRIDIELPGLRSHFYLETGDTAVTSRDFRGMIIDENQNAGTLIGLFNKLVLKNPSSLAHRIVLVPNGPTRAEKTSTHVSVQVSKTSSTGLYAYRVDTLLGRLVDSGDLQSKLFLSHLHCLTAFCLPDQLTSRTGTEEALRILRTAAVQVLLNQTMDNKFFHEGHPETDSSSLFSGTNTKLLARHKIRVSQSRVSTYGAEDHSTDYDIVYKARDVDRRNTATATAAYVVAETLQCSRVDSHVAIASNLPARIWSFLGKCPVSNFSADFGMHKLSYDAKWFMPWDQDTGTHVFIAENWLRLHHLLSQPGNQEKRLTLTTWLAAIACAEHVDKDILHVLTTFFTSSGKMSQVDLPSSATQFALNRGHGFQRDLILNIVRQHKRDFDPSTDIIETREKKESLQAFRNRGRTSWHSRAETAAQVLVAHFGQQWPCAVPVGPTGPVRDEATKYFCMKKGITSQVLAMFRAWFENLQFFKYLQHTCAMVSRDKCTIVQPIHRPLVLLPAVPGVSRGYISVADLFDQAAPSESASAPASLPQMLSSSSSVNDGVEAYAHSRVKELARSLKTMAKSTYENNYVASMDASRAALKRGQFASKMLVVDHSQLRHNLACYLASCQDHVELIHENIRNLMTSDVADIYQLPRISPMLLLEQLNRSNWVRLGDDWKRVLIEYAVALTRLQRAQRLVDARGTALMKELQNDGHTNWDPARHPEWLLLEIEGALLIRDVQVDIATHMQSPAHGKNAVMQLNMGEGKSCVIVPMLVTSLADGNKLMRVIVAKPQSKQMVHMPISKLGGLVNRQVFHLPFSRAIKVGEAEIAAIDKLLTRCRVEGGVLLVQPEHILSFQLMGIEHKISQKNDTADRLLQLHEYMRSHSRDVADESDENFSPKFELVYSLGLQQPIDHSPERWACIQELLDLVRKCLPKIQHDFPHGVEIRPGSEGCFPRARLIEPKATDKLLDMLADQVCQYGVKGFPIAQATPSLRGPIREYIRNCKASADIIARVEQDSPTGFWAETTKNTLLLLRGLIANGILAFAFGTSAGGLAVPYRAKDHPSARSEFSHPDVVIVLTSLSYYYQGLNDDQLSNALCHLDRSDQRADEYATWIKDANGLPNALLHLGGVNLEDRDLCVNKLFPCFRHSKAAVDYFLAHVVFTKEMKEFPHRLSASGWDIGEQKIHPTTGFSGTDDAQIVLPLSVTQTALPAQAHTNALVLQHLLQPETAVKLMPFLHSAAGAAQSTPSTNAEQLLDMVVAMTPPVRVILDVGAQIIELDNLGVAKKWLHLLAHDSGTEAAVFVDKNDNICVVDRKGRVEPLHTSPYCTQLSLCVVFLDDAHTRGTDLKLPEDYRAAATLGANLVKDRLVQACMRMRELGRGQSVVFCVPDEIHRKINRLMSRSHLTQEVSVSDVLAWAICETWHDARRNTALWASQGKRYEFHSQLWAQARVGSSGTAAAGGQLDFSHDLAKNFLEDEAQLIETRYRPVSQRPPKAQADLSQTQRLIAQRCQDLDAIGPSSAILQEEQERELAPEIEEERQLERPDKAEPRDHSIHPQVQAFVQTGTIPSNSKAFVPVYQSLADSSGGKYLAKLAHRPVLLYCTRDFQATIKPPTVGYVSDSYQRPVQWILTSLKPPEGAEKRKLKHMVIISPYEAQHLMDGIKQSRTVTLRLYAPLLNEGFRSLDRLDLYTVPSPPLTSQAAAASASTGLLLDVPTDVILELDLFAGQLYFKTFAEFEALREYLRARPSSSSNSEAGSSEARVLDDNLVGLLNVIMMKMRRECETIDKTHTGKALDGRRIAEEDFKE
ncbi:uncharacterized protein B0I36DRAFT_398704 [Microdochium trichocladiopsis]|uniref:ubiquitinyl hydrolase 1 n=1 Tax=Microdochium trichocladiopsis TaxID=1682393 RepID=A0A9P8XQW8_9PEZI|nr:uncharacterized protein B0I36DRAFT_398704 [Microdochium trichocladiopsis]KAH7012451.1 hypothetical protein B0I36DRAFT_398704 [Microdochium trichocladiopsis]